MTCIAIPLALTPIEISQAQLLGLLGAVFVGLIILQLLIYAAMYRKPKPSQVLVRTGLGGLQVTVERGILAWPIIHAIQRIPLNPLSLCYTFAEDAALQWKSGEEFEGRVFITAQIPSDNVGLIATAAKCLVEPENTHAIRSTLEPASRSTIRDVLRATDITVFHQEPASVEVRLTQSLDLALQAFGLRVRAVHLQPAIRDGIRHDEEPPATFADNKGKTDDDDGGE